ncbi:hypothetical protein CV093_05485 [Oceanobacillus sp. 143]|uniref:Uncharacterized protein n=1 Tax=Oceanobacillus zhaokaii TaxID=2052660 RepID=A0A345PED5_9BACI|nr:hypothetical protein [Oceanobacillus zhaokaii]AXI08365.1 hypothetical protein CUC15_05220 [Oceanobacillus zhaokaii]QGS68264.1 hypothetical protein CV093_05485 [Oceanobacillus sp. 143]
MKLLLGQLAIIALVWLGMAFYFPDMNEGSKIIFYLVTSWMLFLIVGVVKTWLHNRKEQSK